MTDRPVPRYPDTELDVERVIGSSGSWGDCKPRGLDDMAAQVRQPGGACTDRKHQPGLVAAGPDHCGTGGRQVPLDANGVHHLQSRAGGRIGDQRRGVLCVGSFWHPPGSATPSPAPHHRSRRRRPSRQPVSRPEPVVVSMASRTERNPHPRSSNEVTGGARAQTPKSVQPPRHQGFPRPEAVLAPHPTAAGDRGTPARGRHRPSGSRQLRARRSVDRRSVPLWKPGRSPAGDP
jgi:hypothetical protein